MKQRIVKILSSPPQMFLSIAGVFGLISIFYFPILEAPDENQHFQVSYAMLSSNKIAPQDLVSSEGIVLNDIREGDYYNYFTKKTSAQYDRIGINTGSLVFDGKTEASVFDITRLPQAIGVWIGKTIYPSIGVMVIFGRLLNLAIFIAGMYFIIRWVKHGKWPLVFIACLPISIQQAASLSYDGINMLAIFAWFALMVNLSVRHNRLLIKHLVLIVLFALLLSLTKANNIFLLLLLGGLPLALLGKNLATRLRNILNTSVGKAAFLAIIAISIFLSISILGKQLLAGNQFDAERLALVLLNTYIWGEAGNLALIDATTVGLVGQFSNFYYHLPVWAVYCALLVLVILFLYDEFPNVSRKFALISALLFFSSIIIVSIGMYYGWAMRPERLGPSAAVTDGIQGRYFTPLLILLFPIFAYAQKYIRVTVKSPAAIPLLASSVSVFLLSYYILQTWRFFWS